MIQSVLLRFSCGALVTLSLLLTPGLHVQCSDDIFCSLVLLFNCLDWFLWSAHQIPVTIPGLLKENVYPAASQITKALRRVPEIFVISAFIYVAFYQLQKGGLKLKLQFGWAHTCSPTRESEAALSVRVGSVSAWDTRRNLVSKRQQIKQLDFQMWFWLSPFLQSVILLILFFKCVVWHVSAQDRPIGLLPGVIAVNSLSPLSS